MGKARSMSAVDTVKRLLDERLEHPVVSLYLDLNPEEFATAPARASEIDSLIDEAHKSLEAVQQDRDHEERMALRADLDRIRDYFSSADVPYAGAGALAVFCSVRDGLFEVIQLPRPTTRQVVIADRPVIEPLIRSSQDRRWCVGLVSRREARILAGPVERLGELRDFEDDVPGKHKQGGWSQANYERSIEKDADDHFRHVAAELHRLWQDERYDRLALGGPVEDISRLESFLHNDLRPVLVPQRLDVDLSSATPATVREALTTLVEADEHEREGAALDRLAQGVGAGGRAVGGPADVLGALNERRVETLLLDEQFDQEGGRCPSCGVLSLESSGACPTGDGSQIEPVVRLREAAIQTAVLQDADVIVLAERPDLGPFQGIGALLRF